MITIIVKWILTNKMCCDIFVVTLFVNCLKVHSCDLCIKYSKEYVDLNDTSYYCFFRAYSSTNDNLFGNLCMPNNNFIEYIKTLENLFFEKINEYILQPSIINNFIKLFKQVEFVSPCTQFPQDYLIKLFARVQLYYTLKFIKGMLEPPTECDKFLHGNLLIGCTEL